MKKKYKILNLYACLGGNRYKWDEVAENLGIELEVTAVELDPELARMYQERFPNDIVIIADAHQYLLDHFKEFDFIWSSPPCPTHSRARYWNSSNYDTTTLPVYPEMTLYQEILLMMHYNKHGKFLIENVIPYYEPLINPSYKIGRHLYWCNFKISNEIKDRGFKISQTKNELKELEIFHDINLENYNGEQSKLKIGRNLVDYEVGKSILEAALNVAPKRVIGSLFDENYTEL